MAQKIFLIYVRLSVPSRRRVSEGFQGSRLQKLTEQADGLGEKMRSALRKSDMLSRLHALESLEVDGECGWAEALLQPGDRGGGAALRRAPMDTTESQQVQHDRQQDDEETRQEQVVVVDEGEAVPPVRVRSFQTFLLDVPGKTNKHLLDLFWTKIYS